MVEQEEAIDPRVKRRFLFSAFLALVIIVIGLRITWNIGKQANNYDHFLGHVEDAIDETKSELKRVEARKP